jgi:multicomponent Na+:H+ antiporter subunit C
MSQPFVYAIAGALLFVIGVYSLAARCDLLRRILAANIMAVGTFLVLVAMAARGDEAPPDPVPHALVLTGIVVAISATALGLKLARRIEAYSGMTRLPEDEP